MLKQIELPTSEARTPAEKMNAVKQSLAKIEALVIGYNELVPSINAMVEEIKNFELPQIEDNTERLDKIEQSIAQMVELIGSASSSIEGLKTSISQLDKKQKLAVKTVHKKEKYDDSGLMKIINDQSRMMNEIEKKVNSIVIPEIPKQEKYDDSKLLEMINAQSITINNLEKRLNDTPKPKEIETLDVKTIINEMNSAIKVEIEKAIELSEQSLKTSDYIRRSYSEKWENEKYERAKFEREIVDKIESIKIPKIEPCKCIDYDDSGLISRVIKLEEKKGYDDSELTKRVSSLESKPGAVDFDDSILREDISALAAKVDKKLNASDYFDASDLARELNKIAKKVNSIRVPEKYNDKKIKDEISLMKKSINNMQCTINSIFD
jgi:hypothetical protein